MYKKMISSICLLAMVVGCAGRTANPVNVQQASDTGKTCPVLQLEMVNIENNIQRLVPESNKTGKNTALGVAGLLVWPAWFFMDLGTAEKEEINAYRQRYEHLQSLAQAKHCNGSSIS